MAIGVPDLIPHEDLGPALAMNSVGINISRSLGPALGGVITASFGIAAPFLDQRREQSWINRRAVMVACANAARAYDKDRTERSTCLAAEGVAGGERRAPERSPGLPSFWPITPRLLQVDGPIRGS